MERLFGVRLCSRKTGRLSPQLRLASMLLCVLLGNMVMFASNAKAEEEWRNAIQDEVNDIRVDKRKKPQGYTEFRAVTHIDSRLSAFVAMLRDVEFMPQWVDRTELTKVLHRVDDLNVYAYNVSRLGWPFKDRDAIIFSRLEQDPVTLAITVAGSAVPEYDGPTLYDYRQNDRRYVRMKVVESFWRFTPMDDGRVEVIFQGYGDPGGNTSNSLFKWLIGQLAAESPYKTLLNLRRYIDQPEYQNAEFDFIRESADGDEHR